MLREVTLVQYHDVINAQHFIGAFPSNSHKSAATNEAFVDGEDSPNLRSVGRKRHDVRSVLRDSTPNMTMCGLKLAHDKKWHFILKKGDKQLTGNVLNSLGQQLYKEAHSQLKAKVHQAKAAGYADKPEARLELGAYRACAGRIWKSKTAATSRGQI